MHLLVANLSLTSDITALMLLNYFSTILHSIGRVQKRNLSIRRVPLSLKDLT